MQAGSQNVVVIHSPATLLHKSSKQHPENPDRILSILDRLGKMSSLKIKEITSVTQPEKVQKHIILTHGQNYQEFVQQMWPQGLIKKKEMFINVDTYFMKDTYQSALAAADAVLQGIDLLFPGEQESSGQKDSNQKKIQTNYRYAFLVVRPPGHHSGMKSQPHGFSFFNNVAIGVNYALSKLKNKRIAIVDWDVHHGQGTQHLFYNRKDVLFISIHRFDNGKFFPHIKESGSEFVGQKQGEGFTVNVCWNLPQKQKGQKYDYDHGQTVGDLEYIHCFRKIVLPIIKEYEPEAIFVSCGFDSAQGDHIGNLNISDVGYRWMTRQLMKFDTKMAITLEGGYNLDSVAWASEAVVSELLSSYPIQQDICQKVQQLQKDQQKGKVNQIGKQGVETCLESIKKYWKTLKSQQDY